MRQGVALNLLKEDGTDWTEISELPVGGIRYKGADGIMRNAFAHLTVACDGMYSMLRKTLHVGITQCVLRLIDAWHVPGCHVFPPVHTGSHAGRLAHSLASS